MANTPAREPFASGLGFGAIVRVRVLPKITIDLSPFQVTQPSALAARIEVKGKVSNLNQATGCRLTWVLEKEGGSAAAGPVKVAHDSPLKIVPKSTSGVLSGIEFSVQDEKGQPPLLDIVGLGLYGKGALGCELAIDLPGVPAVTLPAKDSGLSIDATAEIEVLDSNGEPFDPSATLQVGTPFQLRPKFAQLFDGHKIQLAFRESGQGFALEPGTEQAHPWTLGRSNTTWAVQAGCLHEGGHACFDFRSNDKSELQYTYAVHVMEGDSPKEHGKPVTGALIKVPKPRLLLFDLSLEDDGPTTESEAGVPAAVTQSLVAHGKFSGFDAAFEFPVEVTLYARYVLDGTTHHDFLAELGTSHEMKSTKEVVVSVRENHFDVRLICLGAPDNPIRSSLIRGTDYSIFAVVRLAPSIARRSDKAAASNGRALAIFGDLIEYDANEGRPGQETRLSPFDEHYSRCKASGTGVCSNTVDLSGRAWPMPYEGPRLPFTPNAKAVEMLRASKHGGELEAILKRPFSDETVATKDPTPAKTTAALAALRTRFKNRFELYRKASDINGVAWEILGAIHINESGARLTPHHDEGGFGIDPKSWSDAQCNAVWERVLTAHSEFRDVGIVFQRGSKHEPANVFQSAIIAGYAVRALVARVEAKRADGTTANGGLPDGPFELGDLTPGQIAAIIASYAAGPSSNAAKNGLLHGTNWCFDPTDPDYRMNHPGGTSSANDGERTVVEPGRRDALVHWDVLLPMLQQWYLETL
jgi:hypothetical protein